MFQGVWWAQNQVKKLTALLASVLVLPSVAPPVGHQASVTSGPERTFHLLPAASAVDQHPAWATVPVTLPTIPKVCQRPS